MAGRQRTCTQFAKAAAGNLRKLGDIFGKEFTHGRSSSPGSSSCAPDNYLCGLNAIRAVELLTEVLDGADVRDQIIPLIVERKKIPCQTCVQCRQVRQESKKHRKRVDARGGNHA